MIRDRRARPRKGVGEAERRVFRPFIMAAACVFYADSIGTLAAEAEPDVRPTSSAAHAAESLDAYTAAEKTTQGNLGHPYVLPPAPRARMHECGVEWQAMKMSGQATDKIWRVFAAACLATPSSRTPDDGSKTSDDGSKTPDVEASKPR